MLRVVASIAGCLLSIANAGTPQKCVGAWGKYGECSASCGIHGKQAQTFKVQSTAQNGGNACAHADGTVNRIRCNRISCLDAKKKADSTAKAMDNALNSMFHSSNLPTAAPTHSAVNDPLQWNNAPYKFLSRPKIAHHPFDLSQQETLSILKKEEARDPTPDEQTQDAAEIQATFHDKERKQKAKERRIALRDLERSKQNYKDLDSAGYRDLFKGENQGYGEAEDMCWRIAKKAGIKDPLCKHEKRRERNREFAREDKRVKKEDAQFSTRERDQQQQETVKARWLKLHPILPTQTPTLPPSPLTQKQEDRLAKSRLDALFARMTRTSPQPILVSVRFVVIIFSYAHIFTAAKQTFASDCSQNDPS